jgi:hypothetical protein
MSGLSNAAMEIGANAIAAAFGYAQLHSAAAGVNGTNNITSAARQPIVWGTATGSGNFGFSAPANFTGGAPSGPVYSVTLWSAPTGGTFGGEFLTSGDTSFNALGQYTVTNIALTGTAS